MDGMDRVSHTITDAEAGAGTIYVDDVREFFPEPGTWFRMLAGGCIVRCRVVITQCRCGSGGAHEHAVIECPGLSSLIDIRSGNRLVFGKSGSLYIVEEAVYFVG